MPDRETVRTTIEIEHPPRRDKFRELPAAGATSLEGLDLRVDSRSKQVVDAGPDRRGRRMKMRPVVIASLIAAALGSQARAQATATFLDYTTTVPAGWTSRTPSSTMRLAEYVVPATGAGGAEVVVYFFGPGQGGNVAANLARWKEQFSTPDGSAVPELVTRDSSGAFPITFAEYRGTYARGVGAGDASQAKPGQILIAGIAETPRGTIFVQLFGPAARVAAEREAFTRFVMGLK